MTYTLELPKIYLTGWQSTKRVKTGIQKVCGHGNWSIQKNILTGKQHASVKSILNQHQVKKN